MGVFPSAGRTFFARGAWFRSGVRARIVFLNRSFEKGDLTLGVLQKSGSVSFTRVFQCFWFAKMCCFSPMGRIFPRFWEYSRIKLIFWWFWGWAASGFIFKGFLWILSVGGLRERFLFDFLRNLVISFDFLVLSREIPLISVDFLMISVDFLMISSEIRGFTEIVWFGIYIA